MAYCKAELKINVDRAQDIGHIDFKWLINLNCVPGVQSLEYDKSKTHDLTS
jgi:hypothetical protein